MYVVVQECCSIGILYTPTWVGVLEYSLLRYSSTTAIVLRVPETPLTNYSTINSWHFVRMHWRKEPFLTFGGVRNSPFAIRCTAKDVWSVNVSAIAPLFLGTSRRSRYPDVSCQCQLSYTRACKATFRVQVVYGVVVVWYSTRSTRSCSYCCRSGANLQRRQTTRNEVTVSGMMRYDSNTASSSKGLWVWHNE